jgi:hypothetical protein
VERGPVFGGLAGLARSAFAGDDDGADPEVVQCIVNAFLPVAAVGGDGTRPTTGALDDPLDGGGQLRGIGWVALVHAVVEDDTVVVVHDLALVTELNRLTEASLGDRPGIGLVPTHPSACPVGGVSSHALTGLRGDPPGRLDQPGQVVDGPV